MKNLVEMGDFDEPFVLNVFKMLQLPGDVEGDMDGRGTNGKGRGDIAFQGVAHHQQFARQDA